MISRQRTIAGLEAMGWVVRPYQSRRYLCYGRDDLGRRWLIGRAGALRLQLTGQNVNQALSMTGSRVHRAICEVGDPHILWESTAQAEATYLRLQAGVPATV